MASGRADVISVVADTSANRSARGGRTCAEPEIAEEVGDLPQSALSTPHHAAANRAIVLVTRRSEDRLTRSSMPWMFSETGP